MPPTPTRSPFFVGFVGFLFVFYIHIFYFFTETPDDSIFIFLSCLVLKVPRSPHSQSFLSLSAGEGVESSSPAPSIQDSHWGSRKRRKVSRRMGVGGSSSGGGLQLLFYWGRGLERGEGLQASAGRSLVLQVVFDVLLVRVLGRLVAGLQQPTHIVVLFWKREMKLAWTRSAPELFCRTPTRQDHFWGFVLL